MCSYFFDDVTFLRAKTLYLPLDKEKQTGKGRDKEQTLAEIRSMRAAWTSRALRCSRGALYAVPH